MKSRPSSRILQLQGPDFYGPWIFALGIVLSLFNPNYAHAAPQLQISVAASVSSVAAGTAYDYTLQYQCASLTENCVAATVSDVLPAALSAASADVTMVGSAHTTAQTFTTATRTAKWTFVNPLPAGSTGQLKLSVKFPVGTTPDGAQAINTATMSATGATTASSAPVTVSATATNKWTLVKTRASGGTGAALNEDVVYQLQVCPNSSTLYINNAVVTDTLPAGAVFVSASGGGTYGNGQVSFNFGNLTTACVSQNLTVRYPTGSYAVGASVTNNATLNAEIPTVNGVAAIPPLTASLTHTLSAGVMARTFTKKASASTAKTGVSLTYYFDVANTGNVGFDNFSIEDSIPTQLNVTSIRSGTISNNVAPTLAVEYQTNANGSWTPVTGFPRTVTSSVYSVAVSSLNLGTGVYITKLRYTYLKLPPAFKPSGSGASPGFTADLLATDRNGAAVIPGNIVSNIGNYSFTYNGTTTTGTSTANVTVIAPTVPQVETRAVPKVDKAVVGSASVLPGATVSWDISLNNASTAGAGLVNPVLGDLLDPAFDYVAGSWTISSKPTGMPNPIFETIANYNGTGRTLLRWRWEGASAYTLPVNTTLKVRFNAKVKTGTLASSIPNLAYLLGYNNADVSTASCYTPLAVDTNDLDGDNNKTESLCPSKTGVGNITVNATAALESVKWVKGQLDTGFSKYPSNGVTVAGGSLVYKLQVTNVGNVAMKNAQIIDILPYSGDSGVLDPQNRQSVWRPNLTAPVVAPAGVVVYYSTQSNLCRPELGYSPAGCASPEWSITPPADITQVQALKFDFGNIVLNPLDKLELTWPMRAPIGAPTKGEIAWNSFGYIATRADNGMALLPSEPFKVGIAVQAPQPPAFGNFVWVDENGNGIQDANEVGLNGVRVDLFKIDGTLIDSTLTTSDGAGNPGFYQFTNLTPGNFYAQFYPPAGYAVTQRNVGNDRAVDSDADQSNYTTEPVKLDWGQLDYNWDMGVKVSKTATVGNYVWYDRNANGIQDEATSDGLNGITVKAFDVKKPGTPAATLVTSDDVNGNPGYFRFDNLAPGTYYLEYTLPQGATFTSQNASGSSNLTASKVDKSGRTANFTVTAGQYDVSWDAGIVLPVGTASLGDRVWIDANNNGLYDPFNGESGVDGVRVNLYRDNNNDGVYSPGVDQFFASTSTYTAGGNPGYYNFSQLPAGKYIVQIDPANFQHGKLLYNLIASTSVANPDNGVDDDNNGYILAGSGAVSKAITLTDKANSSLDFGFTAVYSLGNQVFLDDGAGGGTANDGIRNGGEAGIAGVVVKLYAASSNGSPVGAPVAIQTTDSSGFYRFDNLTYGQYVVVVDKTASPILKNLVNSTGQSSDFTVNTDNQDHGIDTPLANGSVLAGGIASAPVGLGIGQQPLGETLSITALSQEGTSGDANSNLSADFAFTPGYSLGDRVWFDSNQDGVQQPEETGLAGVGVTLYGNDGSTVLQTTVSDGSGRYRFDNVPVGQYVIGVTPPAGYALSPTKQGSGSLKDSFDSDVNSNGKTATINLNSEILTVDAGLYLSNGDKGARISDTVWYDSNQNGVQDKGEPAMAGITVRLWDEAKTKLLATTVSDGRGYYEFAGLPAAGYTLEFIPRDGYMRSPQNSGGNPAIDSDPALVTGLVSVKVSAGQTLDNIDAGFHIIADNPAALVASIGSTVWFDNNQDGTKNPGELGIPGVIVKLYDAEDGSFIAQTKTGLQGEYGFAGLGAGQYNVIFLPPQGSYQFSPVGLDSKADPATGLVSVSLAANQFRTDINAGLFVQGQTNPLTLGDSVWLDGNGDVSFNAGEGLANAQVVLYDAAGQELARLSSSANDSNYGFTGLGQGSYRVAVDRSSLPSNAATVADPDGVMDSAFDVVNATANLNTVDFGYSNKIDFGDLPDSYGTRAASNGPRHFIKGVTLGSSATDPEADGILTDAANGDDQNGATPDDETGVSLGQVMTAGQTANLKVTASAAGVLNAWADWNRNGSFETEEQIFKNQVLVAGLNKLTAAIPTDTQAGAVGFRFRVTDSTGQGGDSATGYASSGEVEDYRLQVYAAGTVGSITGQVRDDAQGDGNLNASYAGLGGANLTLYTDPNGDGNPADGQAIDSTQTTADGQYLFAVQTAGSYVVVEGAIEGYTSTNDVSAPNDDRIPLAMSTLKAITGRDFLDSKTPHFGSVAGQVRNDTTGSGNLANANPGLAGASLSLYTDPNGDGDSSDGSLYGSASSDSNGQYHFDKLPLGHYVVVETNPSAFPAYFSTNDAVSPGTDDQIRLELTLASPNLSGADFLDSQRTQASDSPLDLVAIDSKPLTDGVDACKGNINPLKDVSVHELESFRLDNGGSLVFGFKVRENKEGTENAQSIGVAVKDASLAVTFSNGTKKTYSISSGACHTETYSLLAEPGDAKRNPMYTLIGNDEKVREGARNAIQNGYDSTLKCHIGEALEGSVKATAATLTVQWAQPDVSKGDPEAFYDCTGEGESVALLNADDRRFIDQYKAGRDQAPMVAITNPDPVPDPMAVVSWNHFPSGNTYYMVAYEDQYPNLGDYDFNDLVVAYQVKLGMNADNKVVRIEGNAYLLAKGAAYSHDWHLRMNLPATVKTLVKCKTSLATTNPVTELACAGSNPVATTGTVDVLAFQDTGKIFPNPLFTNYQKVYSNTLQWPVEARAYQKGPKSVFSVALSQPVDASVLGVAPFDPYLYVRDTKKTIQLLEVNSAIKDANGFPYAMVMPSGWLWPYEKVDIRTTYTKFPSFVSSQGVQASDWHKTPVANQFYPGPAVGVWAW